MVLCLCCHANILYWQNLFGTNSSQFLNLLFFYNIIICVPSLSSALFQFLGFETFNGHTSGLLI